MTVPVGVIPVTPPTPGVSYAEAPVGSVPSQGPLVSASSTVVLVVLFAARTVKGSQLLVDWL